MVIEADCPEQITAQIQAFGWDNEYDQMQAGGFRGRIGVAQIGAVQVATLAYTNQILARGTPPPGCITLALVGHLEGRARWRGHDVTPDLTIVTDESVEIDLLMGKIFVLWLLVVPEALLGEAAAGRRSRDRLEVPPRVRSLLIAHIQEGLRQAGLREAGEPAARPMGPVDVARFERRSVALASRAFRGRIDASRPPQLARRFERLARSDVVGELTVPQMACRLQVSERTLRRASRDAFACGPLQFAKTLRLNALWRDLEAGRSEDTCVWQVAARHGFWHMGQLGRDFQQLFAVRPKDVLTSTIVPR